MARNIQKTLIKFTLRGLIAAIVLGVVTSLFFSKNGVWKQRMIEIENEAVQTQIDSLKILINQTNNDIHQLQNDTFYLEEIARTRYGYTKKGERVFIIKETE